VNRLSIVPPCSRAEVRAGALSSVTSRRSRPASGCFGASAEKRSATCNSASRKALDLPHHRVHDARHVYAVPAVRAGTPYELVGRQLGHANIQMVAKIYGKHAPRSDERDRWELIAAEQDRLAVSDANVAGKNSGEMAALLGCTYPHFDGPKRRKCLSHQ
jgi:hypothetical protein